MTNGSFKNEDQSEKLIRLLEDQLAHANEQNKALSQKLDQALDQIEFLNQQLQHNQALIWIQNGKLVLRPTGKDLYLKMSIPRLSDSEHGKNKANRDFYTVVRKLHNKKETTPFVGMSRRRRFTTIRTTPFATVANIR